ncbi:glycosyltransferase [Mycobacterium sp. DL592]|uniref:glycosyltransferase n=1 Tax=Mycobacterium sp. DL592 TaxID=2675524 RepID=UPI001FB97485|nr:glycosyltransferase [Mycobacterium sp. DL592]
MTYPAAPQHIRAAKRVGIVSTYPPTRCGLAFFSAALADGLRANGVDVAVVRIADGTPADDDTVAGELVSNSPASTAACAELLNSCDVAVIQHEYGIYGGADGEDVIELIGGLRVPSIVILHTVLTEPTPHQQFVLETVAAAADHVVVMTSAANDRLCHGYDVDSRKVSTIAHGVTVATGARVKRSGRPMLLTWGLLGPGKGIERVIDVMPSLRDLPGRPRYVVAGRTHPKVLAAEGEAYRESLIARAADRGVSDSVHFEPSYRSSLSLSALVQSAAVVVLPYDSTDQVTSGVLVDAIANGRPVVATRFPHAVELLSDGTGIVVDHDDPAELAAALRRVLTQPCLAGAMAARSREIAPNMAWSMVAADYLALANRLRANRSATV